MTFAKCLAIMPSLQTIQASVPLTGAGTGGFMDPARVISEAGVVLPGMRIADFGCGAGYFTILLAEQVGEIGQVYAVDILDSPLQAVETKALIKGLSNIDTIRANLEVLGDTKLADNSLDLVWLSNVLFQSSKKVDILREAFRVLKPSGKLVLIDWIPKLPLGPKGFRFSPQEAQTMAAQVGFQLVRSFGAGQYHWGLIFKKP